MKTSALRFLGFSLISIFCGTVAAYDADAKLEELKTLQAAMNQAQQEQNLPEAKRLAGEINKLVAEFEAKRAESGTDETSAPDGINSKATLLKKIAFNDIANAEISTHQHQTNNRLVYDATFKDWDKSGFHAAHALQLSGETHGGAGDYAVMIYDDNTLTQNTPIAANEKGISYYLSYDIGPTVYAFPSEATQTGDTVLVELIRGDNTVLHSSLFETGAWGGSQNFTPVYTAYQGDGSGPVRIRLSGKNTPKRFAGAIRSMAFWQIASQSQQGPNEVEYSAKKESSQPADKSPEPVAEADQGSPYAKDVERLVKQRDSESAQAIAPIQKRFDLATQQLLRKATQAGNLDAANKIKAAIDNPPDLATLREEAQSPLDKEFLRLAEQREKDSAIAVAPAQKRFVLAAQQLIRKATQAGNLDAANELKTMIDEVSGASEAPKSASIKSTDPSSKSSSKYKESPEKDFEFRLEGESVVITKYIGNLDKVGVPEKIQGQPVIAIGTAAFYKIENVKEVVLPNTIQSIDQSAFQEASKLAKINIPETVTSIRAGAFRNTSLQEVTIPTSVTTIGVQAFVWCLKLEKINVAPANENYASIDGVLYDKQLSNLLQAPSGLKAKTLKVPGTVQRIHEDAFMGTQVKTIQIPKAADIDDGAFEHANTKVIRY